MKKLILYIIQYIKTNQKYFVTSYIYNNANRKLSTKKKNASKKVWKRFQKFSEEEKEKKRQYGRKRYRNLLEDEKERLAE